ncbi:MAG: polysaccharide pyruvyl transferase family protein [Rugosibacter sp.]|jgi:polysaccharide pyruvyl transferase WcaK-like protein|nr:polysaccharide pyruvyl transferase family protein [Rugosibacter sp.]
MRTLLQNAVTQRHYESKTPTVTDSKIIIYGAEASPRTPFILYGAEASPRPPLSMVEQLRTAARRKLHGYRDVTHFRHGDLSHLDYRNYDGQDIINLGDVAIYQSTAALIQRTLPEADILPINWGELSQYPVKDAKRHKTMLVFSGSGYFFLTANGRLADRIKNDLEFIRDHAIPAFFFGVGLNRPGQTDLDAPVSLHPEDAALVSQLLDYAQATSVRDMATQSALAALTSKPVHLIGDPVLHFVHAMGMQTASKAAAGLSTLSTNTPTANTPPVIGVNFSFHGKNSNALLQKNLESYCAVLLRLQKETGAEFRYFVHYATENILPRLLAQRGVNIKNVGAGDTATLAREYAKLDLHIGGMLHSCILATSAGTPCIALAYDIKHQGFFDLMGLSENCLSAANFNPEALYSRAMDLLANPAPVRAHIIARRDQLESETLSFLSNQLMAPMTL